MARGRDFKIRFKTTGNPEKKFREINKAQGEATSGFDKFNNTATEMASRLTIARVAFDAWRATAVKGIRDFVTEEASLGKLKETFVDIGFSQAEAQNAVNESRERFVENTQFGLEINDQIVSFKELLQVTKDREVAERDLALAVDIQAKAEVDLAGATEIIRKARLGEVGQLKDLGVISKGREEQLTAIKNEEVRTAIAVNILTTAFEGSAEATKGSAEAMAQAEISANRLSVALGKSLVSAGGLAQKMIEIVTFSEDGEFAVSNIATAFEGFADAIDSTTETATAFFDAVTLGEFIEIATGANIVREAYRSLNGEQSKIFEIIDRGLNKQTEALAELEKAQIATSRTGNVSALAGLGAGVISAPVKTPTGPKPREESAIADLADELDFQAEVKKLETLDKEIELRERIAQLRLEGRDLEADTLDILNQQLTPNEQQLALRERIAQQADENSNKIIEGIRAEVAAAKENAKIARDEANAKTADFNDATKDAKELEKAQVAGARAAGEGLADVAELIGAGQREVAAIRGAIEVAESAAAFASFNIAGGIAHGVAAAQFFAVAGGSGGASSGPIAAPTATGVNGGTQASDDAARKLAQEFANELDARNGGGGDTFITVNSRSLGKPTNDEARIFADSIDEELKNRGR